MIAVTSEKLLVVDDDRNILHVIRMRLGLMGYSVTTCADSSEALALFKQGGYSVVLADQRMEGLSGTELMVQLQRTDPFIPVIIMTAHGTVEDAVESVRQGAYTYLKKPIDNEELELHIKKALEKRTLEETLAQEREIWVRVLASFGASVLLLNDDLTVAWMNSIAKQMLKTEGDVKDQFCAEAFAGRGLPCDNCPTLKALSVGKIQSIEYHDSTSGRWFLVTATPLKDTSGVITQAVELILDITAHKKAEEALRTSEEWYRVLFTASPDAIALTDARGRIISHNASLASLLGRPSQSLVGGEIADFLMQEETRGRLLGPLGWGEDVRNLEVRVERPDIGPRQALVSAVHLSLSGGSRYLVVLRDVTELKQAQDAIMEQQRMRGVLEMAGAAAHELSQPMQAILGWGEILRRRLRPDEPHVRVLRLICDQIEELGRLTNKISNVARYACKEYPGTTGIVDLDRATQGAKD